MAESNSTSKRTIFSNLSTFVRWQLGVFAVLTVVGLAVMSVVYVQVPGMFGIGRYTVNLELESSGGLYPHSNVTYRGTQIGVVRAVRLTSTGVVAEMSLDSDYKIPSDTIAKVESVSAVGEQYVELEPPGRGDGHYLRDGSVIPARHSRLPQDVGPMLDRADRMISGLDNTKLQTVIGQAFEAFNGTGPELQRLLDSMRLLIQEADRASGPTKQLIEQIGPLLDTQRVSADSIRAWTTNLASVTDQLRAKDPQLRRIVEQSPGTIEQTNSLFQNLSPALPLVLANLTSIGQVTQTYVPGIQQLLVIFPPLIRALMTVGSQDSELLGAKANFANFPVMNNPPPCLKGFLSAKEWRSPSELSSPQLPPDLYCKEPHNSVMDVRGARNNPCPNDPSKRAATPRECGLDFTYRPPVVGPTSLPSPQAGEPPAPKSSGPTAQPSAYERRQDARTYDPMTGIFIGSDGRTYSQPGVSHGGSAAAPRDWRAMMIEQQGR
ncbi:MAG: MCE family protein [Mycobacteriaceae bacterium]|nr:MCE family protein [Mycobacteriaceae bacterium]